MKENLKNMLNNWIIPLVIGVVVALIVTTYIATFVRVSGESMTPTLKDGQLLVMQKVTKNYKPGDIVVATIKRFDNGKEEDIIKRVIAVGGQTIEIHDGHVYVDDVMLEEDYIKEDMINGEVISKMTVPEGEIFVMGDNRNNSLDSRIQGTIKLEDIQGKILFQ